MISTSKETTGALMGAIQIAKEQGDQHVSDILLATLGAVLEDRVDDLLGWMIAFTFGPGDTTFTRQ